MSRCRRINTSGRGLTQAVAASLEKAIRLIEETPGVLRARALSDDELAALIEPWLGNTDLIADLPLPHLIDVTVSDTQPPDLVKLLVGHQLGRVEAAYLDGAQLPLREALRAIPVISP